MDLEGLEQERLIDIVVEMQSDRADLVSERHELEIERDDLRGILQLRPM